MNRCLLGLLTACAAAVHATPATRADCDADGWATVLEPAQPLAATAHWLDRRHIRWPGTGQTGSSYALLHRNAGQAAPTRVELIRAASAPAAQRWAFVGAGVDLQLPPAALPRLPALLRGELTLVETGPSGDTRRASALQVAGALDDLYAPANRLPDLGATTGRRQTRFVLWAPTATAVAVCVHAGPEAAAARLLPMKVDPRSGAWSASLPRNLSGHYYTYLVDVYARGSGHVRNRVTDPYSLSLNADSRRSWIGDLNDPRLQPPGWKTTPRPRAAGGKAKAKANTELVIYELHLRDFSASDSSVPAADRGKYAAFTHRNSRGMQHLAAMARAGLTDLHLLPVFDLATVPERGCSTPQPTGAADSEDQQALVKAGAASDCFNWGYDPFHFTAPEGSYASDANHGAVRIVEFRRMVQALHRIGLRVGMDVVYNHTTASGQKQRSVLDRIVPGYYQRLDSQGKVETSTCCDNTATEHMMMAKLMIDSAVVWARDHHIDSFRFDLMGHQPRAAMERLQRAVNRAVGGKRRHIHLIGEGWNFGEVADGKRFIQASQQSLNGSGIASFSDRGRDAARGGGCCDNAQATLQRQGWLNGLVHDPNPHAKAEPVELLRAADLVRVGLAGTLRSYRMLTHDGSLKQLDAIDYAGQGAGFASQPGEVVNYVENHDNPTLFDINVLKLPPGTPREDRARVQVLGLALTAFSQGVAYFHAGVEMLRSKSGDRNSFDSGDWFNRIDWTFSDNGFGSGLPPKGENADFWPALKPLLADAANIKPTPAHIAFTRDAFFDLLKIRASSSLFRLNSADDVQSRLVFHNTGPAQQPTVIVGQLNGRGLPGAGFAEVLYVLNVAKQTQRLELPALQGRRYRLHPVHLQPGAADPRPQQALWQASTGTLTVPARTALVYVLP